jgi:hypothetical protein
MNDLSSAVTQLRAQNDTAPLGTEIVWLRRQVEELRALLPALRAEAAHNGRSQSCGGHLRHQGRAAGRRRANRVGLEDHLPYLP